MRGAGAVRVKTARAALALGWGAILALQGCLAVPIEPPAAAPTAAHRPARGPAEAAGAAFQQQILPSGLRVLWDEAPAGSLAGVVSVVRGGSRRDPPGGEGLAHLVEHLTYRAVDGAAGEAATTRWNRLIRDAAAEMNGFTSPDCLIFYELAVPAKLPALIALELARLTDPLAGVDERAFALEREIVGSEHLLRADPRAGQWPVTQMFPRVFPAGHAYARPTGGTDESRARLTLAQARAYAGDVFRPDNVTLLVTAPRGTMSMDAFIRGLPAPLREGRGGQAAPGPVAACAPTARAPSDDGPAAQPLALDRVASPLPTSELWLAWTLPGSYGDQGPAEELLGGWLQQDLRTDQLAKEDSAILYVQPRIVPGVEASVLFVRTLLADKANAEHVAQVVSARVTSLWSREPAARATFAELRSTLEAERLLDEPGQVARALSEATDAALGGRARSGAESLVAVEAVTSSSIAQLAYQHLTRAGAHATLFTPQAPGHSAAMRATGDATADAAAEHPIRDLVPGAGAWDPRELQSVMPAAPEIETTKTSSGLTVVTARRPGVSAVAWLGFRGGYADANPPLLVELALRTRPDARRAPALHMLPARGATRDLSFDAIEFRPAHLNEALALLFAKATTMVSDWPARDELARLLAPVAAAEIAEQKKADGAFWRALFGEHRDARLVSTADLDAVTRSDVDAWIGRVHNVRNAALVVVGDVDPALVKRAAEVLSKENGRPAWVAEIPTPRPPPVRPAGAERVVPVVTARATTLVDLRLGCLLPTMTAASRGADELLARAVEARLNDAIRIEQGDGYGVNVSVQRLRDGATYLVLRTFVPEQSLRRTLSVLRSHWRRWGQTGFDPSELNVARWRGAGAFAAAAANPNALAMELLDRWSAEPASLAGTPVQPDLTAPTAARLNELFATCRANAVLGLTGDEPHLRRALDQAWPGAGR
jgi:zinc protease